MALGSGGDGGWGEIRTHGRDEPTSVFKTGALNRSATLPSVGAFSRCILMAQVNSC